MMLDCVLVNLGEGGEELIVATAFRDIRLWRLAIVRVWKRAQARHRQEHMKAGSQEQSQL